MATRSTRPPRSPQPPGPIRWVAVFRNATSGSWRPAAESPDRTPVLYAIGEMAQAVRARGEEVAVDLWGPGENGEWARFDPTPASPETSAPAASATPAAPTNPAASTAVGPGVGHARHVERMEDRRHQVIMAGLSRAGLYDLAAEDVTAVRTLVDHVDEATLRRIAHWMAVAAGPVE
ncbi:hypothetical protein QFZ66_004048 [Streptomyces sp. B4I13]|uniref:hypothetical protein n=1 Tax=Streptomyces sp. B4I13 TaxID=3042271 RepID=UPI002789F282|nr:hypothetical protein [Streptomyces sp. B4I13]MDQ0960170.1 hypothetical protein [Streptomyces sp. B4I13]